MVNCVDSNGVVLYNHVMDLRQALDKMVTTIQGLVCDEKGKL